MGNVCSKLTISFVSSRETIQGAKAAQKRERNADKNAKGSTSQSKGNEAAKSIVCGVCKQPFVSYFRCSLRLHA
jgi:hypothetical protein